jgi:fatty-acyl-CoA synthase
VKCDSEGYVYVVGRKKDMYISGGENVYPAEVEKIIQRYPGVKEIAVVGVADDTWGEVGKAFLAVESDVDMDALKAYCMDHLAKFKVPKYFELRAELPKGDSGKILKKALI